MAPFNKLDFPGLEINSQVKRVRALYKQLVALWYNLHDSQCGLKPENSPVVSAEALVDKLLGELEHIMERLIIIKDDSNWPPTLNMLAELKELTTRIDTAHESSIWIRLLV